MPFVDVDGINLYYEETGSGPPILFVHGFGQTMYVWRHMREQLTGHRLIFLDRKGCGKSDKPNDGRYGLEEQARLLVGFIEALDLRELILAGHSFGGATVLGATLMLQEQGQDRLRGLIIVDGAAYPQRLPNFMYLFGTPVLGELAIGLTPLKLGSYLGLRQAYFHRRNIPPEAVEHYAWAMSQPGARKALLMLARQMIPPNMDELTARYPGIELPALLIWGQQDWIVPPQVGEKLHTALPNSRLEMIPDCIHCAPEEYPDQTAGFIKTFLTGLG